MSRYRYLIIGGGMTGDACARGIREVDHTGAVGMISADTHPPYNRPPLSKALWKGSSVDKIWRHTDALGVDLMLGRQVVHLNPAGRSVVDDRGESHAYERLVLATGGTPRRLPFGGDRVIYYRSFDDYEALRSLAERGRKIAVIGGGFIGSEITAALAANGKQVTMLFPDDGIGARRFPPGLSESLNEYYRSKGVEVLAGESVVDVAALDDGCRVKTKSGREIDADGVVAGLGIRPNTELAEAAGLRVDDGVLVDEFLNAGHADVFAAGDVARFYNPALGGLMRVEHEDNANTMGATAGLNMAGRPTPYHHLPYFYSDLFDLGYEAVGRLDARLTLVEDWKDPYREGVVYYLQDGRARGVLLWNVWGRLDQARALIAEPGPLGPEDVRGRIRS